MDQVAIVILNWNGRKMLQQYLSTVVKYADGAAVYVADNASTDDSVFFLKEHFKEVRLILMDRNWGFAEGYNKALAQVDAQYYVLLNSDVEVTEHWLTPLRSLMDARPDVAACQPKLLAIHDKGAFEYAGACGGFVDRLGYPFCRGRVFDSVEHDAGQYDSTQEVLWATGACLMIRSEDYWAVNGLDGRFFAHCEEIDLCWRLRWLGRKICCVPQSQVYHVGGGTLPKGNPRKTFLNFRNNLTMLYKNLPDDQLRSVMRWRWLLDYVAAIETLIVNGNWGDFKAIFQARRAYRKWKPQFAADRRQIQSTRRCDSIPEQKSYSILWQYYIKGKHKFSDLPK